MILRVGSLFSGIGGFDLAAERSGLSVAWQVECDAPACSLLQKHWPEVPRHGDIKTLNPAELAPVDVICGGFPCQDVSRAGRRAGLAGARSGLFWEFIRVVAAVRPRWIVLENVPGLLSSQRGRDLGAILGAVGDLGYGWAYRVLDAQWAGVGQRRRRWLLVGCLGDPARAAEVLLEPEGVPGDPPARGGAAAAAQHRPTGRIGSHGVAGTLMASGAGLSRHAGMASEPDFLVPVSRTLTARGQRNDFESETFVTHTLTAEGADASEDGTGRGVPLTLSGTTVRRLTPREAERLQGFPDDWTRWAASGRELADTPRYRMVGNAVAVPVAQWIFSRIHSHKEEVV